MTIRIEEDLVIITLNNTVLTLSKVQAKQLANKLKKLCATTSKYGNKRVNAYGHTFDSEVEKSFYEHLLHLHKAEDIILQPKFILQEKQKGLREIAYIADFQIGALIFDVKGFSTQAGKIKIKMFKAKYPDLHLALVDRCPKKLQDQYGKWINLDDLAKERSKSKRAKTKSSKVL